MLQHLSKGTKSDEKLGDSSQLDLRLHEAGNISTSESMKVATSMAVDHRETEAYKTTNYYHSFHC